MKPTSTFTFVGMSLEYYEQVKIDVTLPRKDAQALAKLLKGKPAFEGLIKDIEYWLKPVYTYKLPCVGCGKTCEWAAHEKLTKQQAVKRWGDHTLCGPCIDSEDFK